MKRTRIFAFFACLFVVAAAHAQFISDGNGKSKGNGKPNKAMAFLKGNDHDTGTWRGLRFAYDRPILKSTAEGSELKQGFNGFTLSYVQSWHVTRTLPLFVEAGGGLSFWRHSYDFSEEDITLETSQNLLGLYIPVNAVYKIKINDHMAVKPYTGFYFRLWLTGKEKYESGVGGTTSSDSYTLFGEDGCDWKRFQMGWQIGASLDYNAYNFGFGYGIDFNQAAPEARFGTFCLRVGMDF